MRITAARAFVDGTFVPAALEVREGAIVSVESPVQEDVTLVGGYLVPGFIDAHCHGGGGGAFTDPDGIAVALAAHRRHGVISLMASLVTDDEKALHSQLHALAPVVARGDLIGVHLEGPWLAEAYRGAHPSEHLIAPTLAMVQRLITQHPGVVRMVTLAPELPGAMEAIRFLHDHGVVIAVGHTAADYDTTRAAIAAGASGATHLFNAMPPLHHRHPGPVLALLEDAGVTVELVFDGVHVHPALTAHTMADVGDRACLVTDAMAAAGSADGAYRLGRLDVEVRGGVARIAGTDTIAGSTLTLDVALRNAVAAGVPLAQAIASVTSTPARYLGLQQVGRIAAGMRADLVHLDDDLQVVGVYRGGELLDA